MSRCVDPDTRAVHADQHTSGARHHVGGRTVNRPQPPVTQRSAGSSTRQFTTVGVHCGDGYVGRQVGSFWWPLTALVGWFAGLARDEPADDIGGGAVRLLEEMGVDVESCRGVAVAEPARHGANINTCAE